MNSERARLYDAITNPKTAADYGQSMPLDEFWAEASARGEHPNIPTRDELERRSAFLEQARVMGAAMRNSAEDLLREILGT